MRKKKRQTKKIYLIREIRKIFDKLPPLGKLQWNKVAAHCLNEHAQAFTREQVIAALWAFYLAVNRSNGNNRFALIPINPGEFIKVDDSPDGQAILRAYRHKTAEKDRQRIDGHAEYLKTDVSKHLLKRSEASNILALAGLTPDIKLLNP